jgi:hypothetical protein
MPDKKEATIAVGGGGIGLGGILTIIFVLSKLMGIISWPWIWVVCPLWIPLVIFVVILLIVLLIALVVAALS